MSAFHHRCPWPNCTRLVPEQFWGCYEHWNGLPQELRAMYVAEKHRGGVHLQLAENKLINWAEREAGSAKQSGQEAAQNPALPEFACGPTSEGKLFLFWPRTGEYLEITRDEAALVIRGFRALLTKGGQNEPSTSDEGAGIR